MLKNALRKLLPLLLVGCSLISCAKRPMVKGQYARLDVPHRTQNISLCLPTCASMALSYYGEERSQYDLKARTGDKDILSGTTMKEMCSSLATLGYRWEVKYIRGDSSGYWNGLTLIKDELDAGHPVIAGIYERYSNNGRYYNPNQPGAIVLGSEYVGHAIVIIGYDEEAQELICRDPAAYTGSTLYSYKNFADVWRDHSGTMRFIIATAPKQQS